ncbi:MAG: hypothetical protein KAQ68_01575 [Clostridiales bacterium]|nr:hypothetical protein [Clostridiales bacterium]
MNNSERHRMSFWIMDNTHKQLKKLADRKMISTSELVRQMITKSLSIQATKDDMDEIRSNIRAELESYLKPQVNRIIKCVIKGGIASSAGYYLNAKAISSFVPDYMQEDYEVALRESKKLGVAHMQVRDRKVDELMEEKE